MATVCAFVKHSNISAAAAKLRCDCYESCLPNRFITAAYDDLAFAAQVSGLRGFEFDFLRPFVCAFSGAASACSHARMSRAELR